MKITLSTFGIFVLLVTSSVVIGKITFKRKINNEVKEIFENSQKAKAEIITQADIKGLPEPVQKYLRYTQVIGKKEIRTVRLKQKGMFRRNVDQKWMPLKAQEYYTINPPAFIWYGNVKVTPLFSITARDRYFEGKGNMIIKLLSLLKVADAKGKEIDEASLIRYLNEIMWFPTAYLNSNIRWESIDDNSAKATISDRGLTVSAILYFNENGEMTNFVAERLCSVTGKKEKWSTPISEYEEIKGIRIPTKGEAIWHLSSGDFSYFKLDSIDVGYNNTSIY